MTMQEQLRALVERHLVHLIEQLAAVTELLTPAGDTLPVTNAAEAQAITHQLKGTAGSMGFPEIGAIASALDDSLKILKAADAPIPLADLQPALDQLASLQRISEATTPVMSKLYNADLSKLA
jgi:HPt (histidine-containing phosphotransfer) domain-containing protein